MKAGVIGHPVNHSKSPLIHRHWLKKYKIDGDYTAIDIAPDDLLKEVSALIFSGYDGFNVTVPHKQSIMKLCSEIDGIAKQIGAVNTVIVRDQKLYGTNTDAFGFIENLKSEMPEIAGKKAMILGAGGAARALIFGLLQENIGSIKISNRTRENAENLVSMARDKITIVDWDKKDDALWDVDLLVNSTVLGMNWKPHLDINLEQLPKEAVVNDIVYAPLQTDLLKQAQERGNKIVTGIGMLLHQARPAFAAWTNIVPELDDELIEKVLK